MAVLQKQSRHGLQSFKFPGSQQSSAIATKQSVTKRDQKNQSNPPSPSTRPNHKGTKSSKSPKRNKRSSPHVGCIHISALLKKQPHNCFTALTRRSHDGAFHCRSRQMPAENDNYKALECPGDTLPVLNIGPQNHQLSKMSKACSAPYNTSTSIVFAFTSAPCFRSSRTIDSLFVLTACLRAVLPLQKKTIIKRSRSRIKPAQPQLQTQSSKNHLNRSERALHDIKDRYFCRCS